MTSDLSLEEGADGAPTENCLALGGQRSGVGLVQGLSAAIHLLTSLVQPVTSGHRGHCLSHSERSVGPPWSAQEQAGDPAPP